MASIAPVAAAAAPAAIAAVWLHARDDVATALRALAAGEALQVRCAGAVRDLVAQEAIPLGHKIALRALERDRRIRKYGEYIGRLTADVPEGGWVHSHNLATAARRTTNEERAWRDQATPSTSARVPASAVPPSPPARSRDGHTHYVPHPAHGHVLARTTNPEATRVFADLGGLPGEPVAAAVDAEDHVWIALAGAGALLRYAPDGTLVKVLRVPVERPAHLAFGASGTGTLYVVPHAGEPADSVAGSEHLPLAVGVGIDGLAAAGGSRR